jgi:hypothetical protein
MIIIPREKPALQDLNSYYLKIDKLLEHYQGALGTGGVYFKSPVSEGVVFFDEDNLLNAYYKDKKLELKGGAALRQINDTASKNNYSVTVYYILPERVYYWANLSYAEPLHSDLSSEFTDLEALIQKMENEKVTGYIDVKLNQNAGGGLLFIYNGEIIGGASARGDGELDRSVAYRDDLIKRCRESGGIFNVKKIQLSKISALSKKPEAPPAPKAAARPAKPASVKSGTKPKPQSQSKPAADSRRILSMVQELLTISEKIIKSNKRIKMDFETLLNKQFVEKVNRYDFLDPFAGEFRYSNGKVSFSGRASQRELATAIVECVNDMASSLGMTAMFVKHLATWKKDYMDEIIDFNIDV